MEEVVSPVETADVSSVRPGPPADRDRQARTELMVGAALVVVVVAVGAVYARRPTAGAPVDRWFLGIVPLRWWGWFTPVTWLRFPAVTVVGSVVAAGAVFRRDRPGRWPA